MQLPASWSSGAGAHPGCWGGPGCSWGGDADPPELICAAAGEGAARPHCCPGDPTPMPAARGASPVASQGHFQITLLLPFPQLDELPGKPTAPCES